MPKCFHISVQVHWQVKFADPIGWFCTVRYMKISPLSSLAGPPWKWTFISSPETCIIFPLLFISTIPFVHLTYVHILLSHCTFFRRWPLLIPQWRNLHELLLISFPISFPISHPIFRFQLLTVIILSRLPLLPSLLVLFLILFPTIFFIGFAFFFICTLIQHTTQSLAIYHPLHLPFTLPHCLHLPSSLPLSPPILSLCSSPPVSHPLSSSSGMW